MIDRIQISRRDLRHHGSLPCPLHSNATCGKHVHDILGEEIPSLARCKKAFIKRKCSQMICYRPELEGVMLQTCARGTNG